MEQIYSKMKFQLIKKELSGKRIDALFLKQMKLSGMDLVKGNLTEIVEYC